MVDPSVPLPDGIRTELEARTMSCHDLDPLSDAGSKVSRFEGESCVIVMQFTSYPNTIM